MASYPEDTIKLKCPYCGKVFLAKKSVLRFADDVQVKNVTCPYCKERMVLRKDTHASKG